jgi:methyltransferase (TIGR00027 family)
LKLFVTTGYAEWRGTGIVGFILARCRYMDDLLSDSLEHGLQQLVILGAGFDSRPYRFERVKQGVKVFEVDHPATQQDKIKRLRKILPSAELPGYVVFVPIDFSRQTLEACLPGYGYSEHLKTLFIWEGVTMYLDPASVDSTLSFVARHSAPGSAIVFDYMYRGVLDGRIKGHSEVSSMRRYRGFSNEVLNFGIEEGQIGVFLKERGFSQVVDASGDELHERYFTGKNARRKVKAGYAIATGVV